MTRKYALLMFSGLIICLIAALFSFGADTDLSKFLFSALLAGVSSVLVMLAPEHVSWRRSSPSRAGGGGREYVGLGILVFFLVIEGLLGRLEAAIGHYLVLISAGGVYIVTRQLVSQSKSVTSMWQVLSVGIGLYALWAFVDFMASPDYLFGQLRPYHGDRLSGSFLSANIAASLLGVGLVVSLSLFMRRVLHRHHASPGAFINSAVRHGWVGLIGVLFCATALLLTASRAGIAIFAFVALVYILWDGWATLSTRRGSYEADGKMSQAMLGGICGIGIIGGVIVFISGGEVGLRYADLTEGSNGRGEMFSAYWRMVLEAPVFGHGPGSFAALNQQAMTADNAHILVAQGAAHNVVLQWLLQSGFVGLLAITGVVLFLLRDVLVNIQRRGQYKNFSRAILCLSFGLLLHSMVDFPLELPSIVWLWALLLGVGAGLSQASRGKTSSR